MSLPESLLFVSTLDGNLHAVSKKSGSIKWTLKEGKRRGLESGLGLCLCFSLFSPIKALGFLGFFSKQPQEKQCILLLLKKNKESVREVPEVHFIYVM